jgi:hypothetical protein
MDIEATLGPDTIGYSTITKPLRETQVTHDSELTPISIEDECQRFIGKAIPWHLPRSPLLSFGE